MVAGVRPGHDPKSALPRLSAPFSRRVKGANHLPAASAEPEATSRHEWTYAELLRSFTRRADRIQERRAGAASVTSQGEKQPLPTAMILRKQSPFCWTCFLTAALQCLSGKSQETVGFDSFGALH